MAILSPRAVSATRLGLPGSMFEVALRTFFQASHYNSQAIGDALEYIDATGTATGSVLDADHQAEANQIICDRTGEREYEDASQWPAAWDEEVWGLTDAPMPASAVPAWAEPFSTYQPDPADSAWAARMFAATAEDETRSPDALSLGLVALGLQPISGGAPVKRRSRHEVGQPALTDDDVIAATGCCG